MRWFLMCLMLLGMLLVPTRASAQGEDITAQQVREALDKGIHFLKRQQRKDGSWSDTILSNPYPGGVTALCTLALLESGVPVEDDSIQRALSYLRKLRGDVHKTYSVALQTMVFCKAEPYRDLATITRNARWLENAQVKDGPYKGGWSYTSAASMPGGGADNSNSQFALLALHEAERVGVKIEGRVLRLAKAYWESLQNADGSWGYKKDNPSSRGSMTCAGIASLVIVNDMVYQSNAQVLGDRIQCCQEVANDGEERLNRAIRWLGAHFSVSHNPDYSEWLLYYLYGLERVGRMTAHRFIGGHDWYREGASYLLRDMRSTVAASGGWRGKGLESNDERVTTSFALLFLAKGRRPVLMSKVKFHHNDDWNHHRSDVGNLTRYAELQWKRDLTWQIIDAQAATVDDLLQSPVLYFTGRSNLLPDAEADREALARTLRDYVDRGGFIFAEADCNGPEFDQGFRTLMRRVFPEKEYSLQLLPPEHPIWRAEETVDAKHLRPLWGIEFGCRTSVVYVPPDPEGLRPSLSCLWELSRSGRDRDYSDAVKAQTRAGLSIGINVLAYATNRELRPKDAIPVKSVREDRDPSTRGRIYIANLRHPGGCNAAPRALVNLMESAAQELKLRTGAEPHEVNITDEALFDYPLVFVQGRSAFRLTDAERKQLRKFVERGGVIFANSICASKSFTESFRREMASIFPDKPLAPIPLSDPLLTPAYGGFDLSTVTRRDPQRTSGREPLKDALRKVPPELDGIKLDDRYGVIFSRYDLSCALEKQNSLECQGYIREDAGRIGLNVLLYSLQH